MSTTPKHTVKTIAFPKGWERFKIAQTGHPGEGWLSVNEFSELTNMSRPRAYAILTADKNMEKCVRLIGAHNVNFYRPKTGR